MLDKQNKHHAKDSRENKHTSLSSWARANSVSLAPPSRARHVWSGPGTEPCPTPGSHPQHDTALLPGRTRHQHCSSKAALGIQDMQDSIGSSTQPAECWGIPGWGEPLSFHLWMHIHSLNGNLWGYTVLRKAIPALEIIFGVCMGCATSGRAVPGGLV